MYEIYKELLDQKGLKNADVSRATGISNMTLSDWKNGKSKPKNDKLMLIADFLGVSVEYLTTGIEKSLDEKYGDDMTHLYALIRNDVKLSKALHKYFSLSEEKKEYVVGLINIL